MTPKEELDQVREQKFRKDMQSVYDKLNAMCLDLCDIPLEDFAKIIEEQLLHYDNDHPEKLQLEIPLSYYNEDYVDFDRDFADQQLRAHYDDDVPHN